MAWSCSMPPHTCSERNSFFQALIGRSQHPYPRYASPVHLLALLPISTGCWGCGLCTMGALTRTAMLLTQACPTSSQQTLPTRGAFSGLAGCSAGRSLPLLPPWCQELWQSDCSSEVGALQQGADGLPKGGTLHTTQKRGSSSRLALFCAD